MSSALVAGGLVGGLLGYAFWKHQQTAAAKDGEIDPLDPWIPVGAGVALGALAVHVWQPKGQATSIPTLFARSNKGDCGDVGKASPEAVALLQQIDTKRVYRPVRNDIMQVGEVYADPKTVGEF